MNPYMDIQVPDYDGRDDRRLGTLTCWAQHERRVTSIDSGPHAPTDWDVYAQFSIPDFIFPIYTRASYDDAAAHGNPGADPTRPYGHLPKGAFKVGAPVWFLPEIPQSGAAGPEHAEEPPEAKKFGPVFIPLLPGALWDEDVVPHFTYYPDTHPRGICMPPSHAALTIYPRRSGLGLHGGPLDSEGRLRPTYGCVRLFDDDAVQVARWVERVLPTVDDLYVLVRGML
jgi:hypothetical protein